MLLLFRRHGRLWTISDGKGRPLQVRSSSARRGQRCAYSCIMSSPPSTLIIGAAGAVGKRLCAALAARGNRVIASDRMEQLPSSIKRIASTTVGNVDVRDPVALKKLFKAHADENTAVWNLAAPLSVDTALDPAVAEAVTVGGMENVLSAMAEVGSRRICFTDSIGSFGASAPRHGVMARWLTENPKQDPGSDYGKQKRGCRELMSEFAREHNGDPRFAVLPGVLHSEAFWGNGTTEYALDALLAAANRVPFVCPVDPDVTLPMVYTDDLMRGLVALQEADEGRLSEPQSGYCLPGLSFSPNELFAEIRKHHPAFTCARLTPWQRSLVSAQPVFTPPHTPVICHACADSVVLNENMNKFAHLWPDDLASEAPLRDLGYAPKFGLSEMVDVVLRAHVERNEQVEGDFRAMDALGTGSLDREDLVCAYSRTPSGTRALVSIRPMLSCSHLAMMQARYMRNYTRKYRYLRKVGGRETYGYISRRQDVITSLVDRAMAELDNNVRANAHAANWIGESACS